MFRIIAFWVLIVATCEGQTAHGQSFDVQGFDAFVEEAMEASNVPGLAVVVFDANGVVYEKPFGIADADDRSVTLDTPFQIGSVSKSFASLLLVQLVAEGKLDLDTPVVEVLPEFRTKNTDTSATITVRHVMNHRSGFAMLDGNRVQEKQYRGPDALELGIRNFQNRSLKSVPGEQFEYSNANYMLVAALVEEVSGQTFESAMAERIFAPLGMTNSYVQYADADTVTEAVGFRQWFGMPKAHPNIAGRLMMGAGGVTASARDLATYVKAIANNDSRIVPAAFADEIISPQGSTEENKSQYGFGWMLWEDDGKKVVYHSGLNGGFAAHAAYYPDEKRGAVVVTNLSGSLQADVAGAVVRKGLGMDQDVPKPSMGQHLTIWGLLASALALIWGFIVTTRKLLVHAKAGEPTHGARGVLPSLALFGLAFFLAKIVPSMNGITLSGMKVFFPDLWLCISACAVIAAIWGVARLLIFFKYRSAVSD